MLIELKLNDQARPDGVNSVSPSSMIKFLRVCKHKHYQFCTEGRQRTTVPLILPVRHFSARPACCQETTEGSGYKTLTFLQNVITVFQPLPFIPSPHPRPPFMIFFPTAFLNLPLSRPSINSHEAHPEEIWRACEVGILETIFKGAFQWQ